MIACQNIILLINLIPEKTTIPEGIPQMKFIIAIFCLLSSPVFAKNNTPLAPTTPPEDHPNRIVLWGGYGPDGLTSSKEGLNTVVKPNLGPLVGASYAHRMFDQFSINGEMLKGLPASSSTYIWMGGVGFDF
jgi:hypothetical protein